MHASAALITDLDGTLLGDAGATRRFIDWWAKVDRSFRLVYASGRNYRSVLGEVRKWNLPIPDAVISGVGTEIHLLPEDRFCAEWPNRWWLTWNSRRIAQTLDSFPGLNLQPIEFQSSFKRSYYLYDANPDLLCKIRQTLLDDGLRADVIYSSRRDLDVLPAGVSKGSAAEFLIRRWGVPDSQVMVAGNSGNDLSLFTQQFLGIVVSNAHEDLKMAGCPFLFFASRTFADGVIDGIEFWRSRQ